MTKNIYNKPFIKVVTVDFEQYILAGSNTLTTLEDPTGDTSGATTGGTSHNSADAKYDGWYDDDE
jgi:hypothetical protein